MLRRSVLLPVLLLWTPIITAQVPTMKVTGEQENCVTLKSLHIDIRVIGNLATTSMEMVFLNTTGRILEGTLTFPLPQGVSVSGYALDINGKLRDAVPVEKEKATRVFENIERRKVDPGLMERVEGNNFRTRIYPILAFKTRTIRIQYNEILPPAGVNLLRYSLPLVYSGSIPDFKLNIQVLQSTNAPVLEENPAGLKFNESNKNYTASLEKKDFAPHGNLRFAIPLQAGMTEAVMQKQEDNHYFMANLQLDQPSSRKRTLPGIVGLIWDASISGLKRNVKLELELLDKYFKSNPNCIVELGVFSNSFERKGRFAVSLGNWQSLKTLLESIPFDGATNLSAIKPETFTAREILMISDGMSTYGEPVVNFNSKSVFTISSSRQSDFSWLQFVARKSGAEFINLVSLPVDDALRMLTEETFRFIRVRPHLRVAETYPSFPTSVQNGNFSLTGISPMPVETITLEFGYGNVVTMQRIVRLNFAQQQSSQINLQRFWAEQKIAELDLQYEKNKDVISYLGRQHSIVTRNTSLLVLETIDDYIRYGVEPPSELKQEYYALLKARRDQEQDDEQMTFDYRNTYKALHEWWKPNQFRKPVITKDQEVQELALTGNRDVGAETPTPGLGTAMVDSTATMGEVVVIGYGNQRRSEVVGSVANVREDDTKVSANEALSGKVAGLNVQSNFSAAYSVTKNTPANLTVEDNKTTITVADWSPKREYLEIIGKVEPALYYAKYLEVRKDYLQAPTYYFDVAGFLFRSGEKEMALKVLSNIAELNIEDHELYTMLGYRLREAGDFRNALHVFKKIREWRPHEPQSYRNYALALADMGKWQEAADVMYSGITREYDEIMISEYEGIDEVMLMEFNNILAQQKGKINTHKYSRKVMAILPVDVRVVLNWNRNDTDIDLWVTDPKGEKCFYGNENTSNGAILSADITQGYGPEQMMVKKALKGKYKIEVNYFGDDQVRLTGPSTLLVEIYTRYNSSKQERKMITLQMDESSKQEGVYVGEFVFN